MRSKHLLMSASNTYLVLPLIALKMLPIASWQLLPGRNPWLLASNIASHSGSSAAQEALLPSRVSDALAHSRLH